MRNRTIFHIILCLFIFTALTSCKKESLLLTIAKQEENIDKFISTKYKDNEIIRKNGSNRIVIEKEKGADIFLEKGDSLYLYYAGYTFTSSPSRLFSTNIKEIAEKSNFELSDTTRYEVAKILYNKDNFIPGLYNGLDSISNKEHSIILFSAKYGFYNEEVYNIPKLSALVYEVWVDNIIKKE